MFSNEPNKKIAQLTKHIPALAKVPENDRQAVFKSTFRLTSYKLYLGLIVISFISVFYFNLDDLLNYESLERGGMIARSLHFFKELGVSFFLPLMVVMAALIFGRNYFVTQQVSKYLESNKNS